jgi:hypothetical protein
MVIQILDWTVVGAQCQTPGDEIWGKGDVCSPSTRQEVSAIGTDHGRRRAPPAWTRAVCYSRAFGALLGGVDRTVHGAAGDLIEPTFPWYRPGGRPHN